MTEVFIILRKLIAQNTTGADIMAGIVVAAQRIVTNALTGSCCVNKLTAADIDTNVTDLRASGSLREEDQIADLQLRFLNLHRIGILVGGSTGQAHTKVIEYILNIARTVKTTGSIAAVNVLAAQQSSSIINDLLTGTAG